MAEYAVSMIAQQWPSDSYYVASSAASYPITVIAETKQEGIDKAAAALGPAHRGRYWRFFHIELKDVRLIPEPKGETPDVYAC